jgi:hydrogenase expression/formation protein HypC
MCLAMPAQVIELTPPEQAVVDMDGIRKTISLALTPDVVVGDYVIVHVGFALQRLDIEEALRTLALFRSMASSS